jgi:hypothetical protein
MKRHISILTLTLAMWLLTSASLHAGGPKKYMGIFECGTDEHALVGGETEAGLTWNQFGVRWWQKSGQGLRLVDFENYSTSAGQRYTGVFREGSDSYTLVAGVKWPVLYDYWMDFNKFGLELVDAEVHGSGLNQTFDGVFRQGDSPYNITQQKWDGFVEVWKERSANGWRLFDVEITQLDSGLYYRGHFRKGNGPYGLWVATWPTFVSKWQEWAAAGLRLVDVETFKIGAAKYYLGVWEGTTNGQALVSGKSWSDFLQNYSLYTGKGFRLTDIEVIDSGYASANLFQPKKLTFEYQVPGRSLVEPPAEIPEIKHEFSKGFIRGDADVNGILEMADALALLQETYAGKRRIGCADAADANDDGAVDLTDALRILNYLYSGGPAPAGGPVGEVQEDFTEDRLGCLKFIRVPLPPPVPEVEVYRTPQEARILIPDFEKPPEPEPVARAPLPEPAEIDLGALPRLPVLRKPGAPRLR